MKHPIHVIDQTYGKQYAYETQTNESHRYVVTALLDTQPLAQAHAETYHMAKQLGEQFSRIYNQINLPLEIAIESYATIHPERYTQQ